MFSFSTVASFLLFIWYSDCSFVISEFYNIGVRFFVVEWDFSCCSYCHIIIVRLRSDTKIRSMETRLLRIFVLQKRVVKVCYAAVPYENHQNKTKKHSAVGKDISKFLGRKYTKDFLHSIMEIYLLYQAIQRNSHEKIHYILKRLWSLSPSPLPVCLPCLPIYQK